MGLVATNAKIWLAQFDISGNLNAVAADFGCEHKDGSAFGDTVRDFLAGVKTYGLAAEGLFDADGSGKPDDILHSRIGSNPPISIAPNNASGEGDLAFTMLANLASYTPRFQHGEPAGFSLRAEAGFDSTYRAGLARGMININAAITSTSNGPYHNVGSPSATQRIGVGVHVLSGSGTLDLVLVSASDSGGSGRTVRLTVPQFAAAGSFWGTVDGSISHSWWRLERTVGGGSPSFEVVAVIGIL